MANPTTNFGWVMPTSTDLVTDLPADFNTFGQAVDTSMADLKGGTTGQILAKATNADMDFTWVTNDVGDITAVTAGTGITGGGTTGAVTITNSMATEIAASGDIIVGTGAGTFDNLPIGTTGQVLTADTTVSPYKVKWATPASAGSGPAFRAFRNTSDQSISSTTVTKVQLNGETFDTNSCFDSTTNYRFTPTTAGYYLINAMIGLISGGAGYGAAYIYKNGSRVAANRVLTWDTGAKMPQLTDIIYLNGSTDYIELYTLNNGASASVAAGTDETWLTGAFIHS